MNLLLDTCAILHVVQEPDRLSERARGLVANRDNTLFVAAISVAELACLAERARIVLPRHWKTWFRDTVEKNGWNVCPLSLEVIEEAYSLPEPMHRDPVDRMLVALSRLERMPLVTTDRLILDYPHVQAIA